MQVEIDLTVTFQAPFSVGTGALGDALTNRPTIKNGKLEAIIPGSSLKGRLRHRCERLLRALLADDAAACGAPNPANTCPLDPAWLRQYCPICRIFGSPRRPGPLMFSDLTWHGRLLEKPPTLLRTGVSIRRSRRVAEPQRLYDLEAVDAAAELLYRGTISGHLNDDDAQALAALLWAGLRELQTLGGGRGSGLGRCRVTPRVRAGGRAVDDAWLRAGLERGMEIWPR